jgi:hypothetical protein
VGSTGKESLQVKRAVFIFSLVFFCLAGGHASFGQSTAKPEARPDDKNACPFDIAGLWRMEGTTEVTRLFFDFSPEGHITMMDHSPDRLPQDFEMVGTVNYKLDKARAPKSIEFINTRGNDAFQPGITVLDIVEYGDDSFTTREPSTGTQTRWVREQTHRYFITFVARAGTPEQGGPAFAMWTVLDGRQPKVKALGVQFVKDEAEKVTPVFGPIPAEIYERISEQNEKEKKSGKEETVVMRFEVTRAEFEKTRKVYESWEKNAEARALPHADAYQNAVEFFTKAIEGLMQCGEKVRLRKPTQGERAEIVSKFKPPQHLVEYVRVMRKSNGELHVSDVAFPWQWRPMIQPHGL